MNVTLTNTGPVAVPFSSDQDKGFAVLLEPSVPYTLNSPDTTVANVGDNPSAAQEFAEGIHQFVVKLGQLVTFWRERAAEQADDSSSIAVKLENHGPNALRVLLGSNMNEVQVSPGTSYIAEAVEYVEIRELGT